MKRCAACHHEMIERVGELDVRINGQLYIVRGIPYEECPVCGERVISPRVSQQLFERIMAHDFVEETMRIPVLAGAYA
jgi:YgiT-type zinc finger domain-containing protein